MNRFCRLLDAVGTRLGASSISVTVKVFNTTDDLRSPFFRTHQGTPLRYQIILQLQFGQ